MQRSRAEPAVTKHTVLNNKCEINRASLSHVIVSDWLGKQKVRLLKLLFDQRRPMFLFQNFRVGTQAKMIKLLSTLPMQKPEDRAHRRHLVWKRRRCLLLCCFLQNLVCCPFHLWNPLCQVHSSGSQTCAAQQNTHSNSMSKKDRAKIDREQE